MVCKLKVLSVACVAMLVIGCTGASMAAAGNYHSVGTPTTITGFQTPSNALHIPGAGAVECANMSFHGSQSTSTSTHLTIHPTYTSCKAFGFANAHVTTTGCDYTFTEPTGSGPYTAKVDIACSAGNSIKITPTFTGASVCTMTIGSQEVGGAADFKNEGAKVLLTSTLTGIKHSAGCGVSEASDATYTGGILLEGSAGAISVSGESAPVTPSYHNTLPTITGSQTGATKNILTVPSAGSVECSGATFHSSQTSTTGTDLTIHPTYSGCAAFGLVTAHVTTTGCDYTLRTPTASGGKTHAKVDIACSAGNSIKITPTFVGASVCTMTIGSQEAGGVVDLKNEAGGKLLLTWTLTGIKHSAGCEASEASDATYTKEVLLEESSGSISVSEGNYHRASTIVGSQVGTIKNILTVPSAGSVECSEATFHGAQTSSTSTDLTIHPTYGGCKAFGYATAHVTTTGCDYTFTEPAGSGPYTAKVDIACSAGNSIKITPTVAGASVCTMTIGSQIPGGTADLANSNPKDTVNVKWTLTGIKHSAGCGASEASDATYTKEASLEGSNNGVVWIE